VVTPTLAGVSSQLTITPGLRLSSGDYTLPVVATGGGVTRTLDLVLHVQQPGLSLSADPDPVTLASEESQAVQIAVASLHGGQDDGLLLVKSSPMGLQVGLDKTTVGPGDNVTLIMTDTQGLVPGDHALVLQAVGPYHIATYTLTVQAVKGGYGILAQPTAQVAVREQVVAYELTLARTRRSP